MKKALNEKGIMIDIIESNGKDNYICPVCNEKLTRKFGAKKQYFAHPSGKGEDCELKLEVQLKEEKIIFEKDKCEILQDFYNKDFNDVKIELSDYKSDDGYFLTKQQKDIIMSKEDKLIVSSLAGSSKSTTLYYYAKERPYKKFLYIVYNKSQKDEADMSMGKLKNVEVKTVHGLAYKYVGRFYQSKLTFNYGVVDIIKDLKLDWNNDMQLASQIKEFMSEFMLSSYKDFEELEIFPNLKPHERHSIISNCRKLWNLKKDYNNNVKVEHDFYLKLFQLGEVNLENTYDGLLLDECLPSSQFVTTDKGDKSIKYLYELFIQGKELPNILSYNIKEDKFEYKPMLSAMKSNNRDLVEIMTEGLNKIHCTPNHRLLTQRGYVRADELIIGKDSLILNNPDNQKAKYKLNEDQRQLVLGSFLGDGHLQKMSKFNTFRLNMTHGEKQLDYLESKLSAFNLGYRRIKSGYTGKDTVFQSSYTKIFMTENNIWNEMKTISPLGLAIWYQDDGSFSKNGQSITINSNAMTEQQTKFMSNILESNYGIKCEPKIAKEMYWYIYMNRENSSKFLEIVSPFMHKTMQYKTYIDISNNSYTYNNKYLNHAGNYVKSVSKSNNQDVYDIEVKDNHNFITSRSRDNNGSGVVVHNCQDSSLLTLSVILNSNIQNIVLVGDMYQSLYKWRKSVNIMSLLSDATEYKLTTSFRVSQHIAELSNMVVDTMIGDSINMSGFNTKQTIVDKVDRDKPYAILCRTNAMILGEVIENSHKKIYYNGGFKGYNFNNIKDAYFFSIGKPTKNSLFTKFKTYKDMMKYAEEVEDLELLSIDRVLIKYGNKIPSIVDNLEKNSTNNPNNCDIWISTIHKAKGSTIKLPLIISNDHYDINNYETDKVEKPVDFFSECCIIYVAITRASGEIELSDSLKLYLLDKLKQE